MRISKYRRTQSVRSANLASSLSIHFTKQMGTFSPKHNLIRFDPIIRGFLGNNNVMDMTFTKTGRRNLHELRVGLQISNGGTTKISHTRTQTAEHLFNVIHNRSFVRHSSHNALRNQFM